MGVSRGHLPCHMWGWEYHLDICRVTRGAGSIVWTSAVSHVGLGVSSGHLPCHTWGWEYRLDICRVTRGAGSIVWTSAVSHVGRTLNAFKVTMKLQMVVTSRISVQYL